MTFQEKWESTSDDQRVIVAAADVAVASAETSADLAEVHAEMVIAENALLSAELARALARVAATVPVLETTGEHHYISTACVHDRHHDCRRVCKFCPADCVCECHEPFAANPQRTPPT